jgi:peptidoglycan/xylan/chitin deacetylase (PgdA/CDA1 family)
MIPTVSLAPTPTLTPSPKSVSFEDLNKKYGPCVRLPVLMFHHIESEAEAKLNHQTSLAVTPEHFTGDMEYLKTHGYTTIFPKELINFFDNGIPLPKKAVMITLDDAYGDSYTNAYPILKQYGFKATIFTPTGLVQNPGYLNWEQIKEMSGSGLVYFANHTWSHHNSAGTLAVQEKEISLADGQLAEKGLNNDKVFAYPYGNPSIDAEKILTKYGYKLAFTTVHGNISCEGKRLTLPRIRIGNAALSSYGL